ncbi:Fanconi anemia group G protein [Astyanax mexicanus]|uniref:Fanconi anemia group G protein n=1 Tax=Astyanax mexicanus TaxID=7994 RepID=UPI0020CAB205|nr:Fanconi anemia group G protein [Astyanax mexicanus]
MVDMPVTASLFNSWAEENNNIIRKWKEYEKCLQPQRDTVKQCYTELIKLQQKIQGLPATAELLKLDLTVSYNTLLFSLSHSKPEEIRRSVTDSLIRVLEVFEAEAPSTDPVTLWQVVSKTVGGAEYQAWIHPLLLIQWVICLSECQFEEILHLLQQIKPQNKITSSGDLLAEIRNLTFSIQEDASLLVAIAAKDLKDLLHICTFISKGVELMNKENYTESLLAFQEAATLSSPRTLLAHVHTLTGLSFTKLGRLQSALHCNRKALEVDFSCQRALYQSSLVYKQLGNSQAEIEALNLLHSAALLNNEKDPSNTPAPLISPEMLLGKEQMAFISQKPSPVSILHTLAHRCVLNDRNSEGAEYYLDLLASLQPGSRQHIPTSNDPPFPRIPVIYLEAAFAMLKARRSWDTLAICDEVITETLDLIPERMQLHPPISQQQQSVGHIDLSLESETVEEKLDCVLWCGAAYFLQGHAHLQLKDTKEALVTFTRAINQLVKVFIKEKFSTVNSAAESGDFYSKVATLDALKGRTLAGRGVCFVERGQLKEALRDFQLSCQASPGCRNTEMWLVEILWRLNRKEEAAALWKHNQESTDSSTLVDMPLHLQTREEDLTHIDHSSLNKNMEEFIQSCSVKTDNNR